MAGKVYGICRCGASVTAVNYGEDTDDGVRCFLCADEGREWELERELEIAASGIPPDHPMLTNNFED